MNNFSMSEGSRLDHDLDPVKLKHVLPSSSGVYLFRDQSGRIIYVGKAKDLSKRVLSYFRPEGSLGFKTSLMMKKAHRLDFITTATENEAFILESQLIRKHLPRYNIVLRDDKRYPSLRLDVKEEYPRLTVVRKIKNDGALYFGPYASGNAVRSTLRVIERVFPLRKCKTRTLPRKSRPCLNHQMGRCLGPCSNDVTVEDYGQVVEQVRLFLEGHGGRLRERLAGEMARAAKNMDFEKAIIIRERLEAIKRVMERQHVASTKLSDLDVIGIAQKAGETQVVVLLVRRGEVAGTRDFIIHDRGLDAAEVVEAFVKQYYAREERMPKEILVPYEVRDNRSITAWLSEKRAGKVGIRVPLRGEKTKLLEMAMDNAEKLLNVRALSGPVDTLEHARNVLGLERRPVTIEGLDISNLQGDRAVGSFVLFSEGLPHKTGYRHYRIKNIDGIDDYAMMAELVSRRLARGDLPDLFLVDGGKGHLSAVKRVLDRELGEGAVEVIAIAKSPGRNRGGTDRIFLPGRKNAVKLRADDPVLMLMARIRDEAHRRAVDHHRMLRKRDTTGSRLDAIPGVGGGRKKILLSYFNDIEEIKAADAESLSKVPGIGPAVAHNILSFFKNESAETG